MINIDLKNINGINMIKKLFLLTIFSFSHLSIAMLTTPNKTKIVNDFLKKDFFFENLATTQTISSPNSPATAIAFNISNDKFGIGFNDGTLQIRNPKKPSAVVSTINYSPQAIDLISFLPYEKTKNDILTQQTSHQNSLITIVNQILTTQQANYDEDFSTNLEIPAKNIAFRPKNIEILIKNDDEIITKYYKEDISSPWKKDDKTIKEENPTVSIIYSPLLNGQCSYAKNDPTVIYFTPYDQNIKAISEKMISITSNQAPIEKIFFNWEGNQVAIVTEKIDSSYVMSSKNNKKFIISSEYLHDRISIWDLNTGKLIKTLNIPDNKSINSISFTKDQIALLFTDGTINLQTYDNAIQESILKETKTKPWLNELIFNAITATNQGSTYTIPSEMNKEFKKEPQVIRDFLNKHLKISENFYDWLSNLSLRNKAIIATMTAAGLASLYYWFTAEK